MNLVSLKLTPEEKRKEMGMSMLGQPPEQEDDKEKYPYGTHLYLEGDIIAKLGLGNVQAGAKVRIVAIGAVEKVEVEAGDTQVSCVGIQITDMAVEGGNDTMANMFPTMKE